MTVRVGWGVDAAHDQAADVELLAVGDLPGHALDVVAAEHLDLGESALDLLVSAGVIKVMVSI